MNFGGPVWHASVRSNFTAGFMVAKAVLAGVGDATAGEWREHGRRGVVHLRRRLTAAEAVLVGPVRDIRGTPEEAERIAQLLQDAPHLRAIIGGLT